MHLDNPSGYGRLVRAPDGGPALIIEDKDATPEESGITRGERGPLLRRRGVPLEDALASWTRRTRSGSSTSPTSSRCAADGPGAVSAHVSSVEAAGVNDQEELSLAARALTRRIGEALMGAGVTIEDPERFDVDEGVTSARTPCSSPSVRLRGRTVWAPAAGSARARSSSDTEVADGVDREAVHRERRGDRSAPAPSSAPSRGCAPARARRGRPRRELRRDEEGAASARARRRTTSPTSATRPSARGRTSARAP